MATAPPPTLPSQFLSQTFLHKFTTLAACTPFVVCLAAGDLERDAFRRYIAQDVHFLCAFARAYEIAQECTDGDDTKAVICELRNAVMEELEMHDSVMEEWGIDPTKEIVPTLATVKYTNFLLATAAGNVEGGNVEKTRISAYTVGAMTPCMRLYASLGKELRLFLHHDKDGHPYKDWINNYSSKSFEVAAVQIEKLLDKLSVPLTGEELDVMEKLYYQAMKLEVEFFSSQPVIQPAVVPLTRLHDPEDHFVLFCDFDITCTIIRSAVSLVSIAILKAAAAVDSGADNLIPRRSYSDGRNLWEALSWQYHEEYKQCIKNLLPKKVKGFNYNGLCNGLEQLSLFEKRANSRVLESGILSGVTLDNITKTGECVIFQDDCEEFFQKVINRKKVLNADFHILSYCWSADFIRSAFSSVDDYHEVNIHSNEFIYENSVSTGEILRKMETPLDKLEAFRNILSNRSGEVKPLSVYIGHTVGDLLCLLNADVGIVINSSPSLRFVGEQFGVSFVPLLFGLVTKQRQLTEGGCSKIWTPLSGVLYTVSCWSEIEAFILGA